MSRLFTTVIAVLVLFSSGFTASIADITTKAGGNVGDIKGFEDGASVTISGPIVTAISPLVADGFYVESADRSSGIRIVSTASVQLGDSLSISGTMGTRGWERVIEASDVTVLSSGNTVPSPLGVSCETILTKPDSLGKNVRAWGKVSGVDTANPPQWFGLTDGSGKVVKCRLGSGVAYSTGWTLVTVTGVASVEDAGGQSLPVILVGSTGGIRPIMEGGISGKVTVIGNQVISQMVESLHPYLSNTNETWTITGPEGTFRIRCHFMKVELETGYDYLYIKDGTDNEIQRYSNTNAFSDVWSPWVPGDILKLHLTSDGGVQRYGFKVDKYEVELPGVPVPGVTLTLSPGNITTLTGTDGAYSFNGLSDGVYTVTPSLAGATFTPLNRTVTVSGGVMQGVSFVRN